ncbi:MAG: glycosyltransferase [Bacteroidota bacterium]|nr:glycosyltransferase [Bacteroidota bacterium]
MTNQPLVSVIICSYNHAVFLPDAINSILYQDYPAIEIMVVDDGSTDNTAEVVKAFPLVKYFYKTNAGLAAGRNTGIEKSTGEYLVFLDADDWLLPGAIRINAQKLEENPEVAFVSGGHISVDMNGDVLSVERKKIETDHFKALIQFNYIGMHATVMYRKFALTYYPFDPALKGCDDYDSYLAVAAKFPVLHHTQIIAAYRKHDNNMSGNLDYMLQTVLNIHQKHTAKLASSFSGTIADGRKNWINYYSSKAWKRLTGSTAFFSSDKRSSFLFLAKYNPAQIKSYIIGTYRRSWLKKQIKHIFPFLKSKNKRHYISDARSLMNEPPIVLMYHKIGETISDPWSLCISEKHFEQQLEWLKKNKKVISVAELEKQLENNTLENNTVVLTFDDGYEDNFSVAVPLLSKYQLPATFFIVSGMLNGETGGYYFWDALQTIFLETEKLPSTIAIKLYRGTVKVLSGDDLPDEATKHWSVFSKPFNKRTKAFYKLWLMIRNLSLQDQKNIVEQVLNQLSGEQVLGEQSLIATLQQVQDVLKNPLITLGAHTVTHPVLPAFSLQEQLNQLSNAKDALEKIVGKEIRYLSYPYGECDTATINIAREAGFKLAFTTACNFINGSSDHFAIGRFQVKNWNANELAMQMQHWCIKHRCVN